MKAVLTLPNGAGQQSSAGFDVGADGGTGNFDVLVSMPALTTAELPDTKTMTYTIVGSSSSDMSNPTALAVIGVQTGAGGVGAAAAQQRWQPNSATPKYLGLSVVNSGSGNASGKQATAQALF